MKLANNETSSCVTTFDASQNIANGLPGNVSRSSMSSVDDGKCVDQLAYIFLPVLVSTAHPTIILTLITQIHTQVLTYARPRNFFFTAPNLLPL